MAKRVPDLPVGFEYSRGARKELAARGRYATKRLHELVQNDVALKKRIEILEKNAEVLDEEI